MMKILILLQLVVKIAASVGNDGVYADEWPSIQHGEPMDVR
jgi:hypothetical protein